VTSTMIAPQSRPTVGTPSAGSTPPQKKNDFATWGPWVAMLAAVVLTAKGEYDLAVLAHFHPWIAALFPVMIDVYVVAAFHRRRWADMFIAMLLMIFCQIAVHLLPVYINPDEGEQTPWGLVVAVACIAPIVVVRVKMLTGHTEAEISAEQSAAQRAEELRAAQAEIGTARGEVAEIRKRLEAETLRAETEIAARAEAETVAAELPEIRQRLEAEIAARGAAERHAGEQLRAAQIAEGQLVEARAAADRAGEARVVAEQQAAAQVAQVTAEATAAVEDLRQQLATATGRACYAETQVADLERQVRGMQSQLDEARAAADRATESRVLAERELTGLQAQRDEQINEIERLRRALARAQERAQGRAETRTGNAAARQPETRPGNPGGQRAEIPGARRAEIERPAGRKVLAAVPVELPENLPVVETVKAETVARVLAARVALPDATQGELNERTGISDRTIRKVLTAVPADRIGELAAVLSANEALALPPAPATAGDGEAA
jgi:hypothetical protein